MNGTDYVLDTNIVLYLLAGNYDLWIVLEGSNPTVSVITEMELLSFRNLTKEDEVRIRDFLEKCQIESSTDRVKEQAIAIRKANRLKLPDSIVAATAVVSGYILLTADKRLSAIPEVTCMLYTK